MDHRSNVPLGHLLHVSFFLMSHAIASVKCPVKANCGQTTWLCASLPSPCASGGLSLAPLEYLSAGSAAASTGSTAALLRLSQPQLAAPCWALGSGRAPHDEPSLHNTLVTQPKTTNNAKLRTILSGHVSSPAHIVATLTSAKSRGRSAGFLT